MMAASLDFVSQNEKENLKTGFKGSCLSTKLDMLEGDEGGCAYCAPPPPTPLSNPDVELLTSWGGGSAPGQGHTEA